MGRLGDIDLAEDGAELRSDDMQGLDVVEVSRVDTGDPVSLDERLDARLRQASLRRSRTSGSVLIRSTTASRDNSVSWLNVTPTA